MNQEVVAMRARIDDLADQIAICAARIDAAVHQLLSHIRQFDALKGWSKQGSKSCAHWLSWRIGVGMVAAREKVRVATALATLPEIDAALSRGELSYAKVRAMTRVASAHNEDLLLAQAKGLTGAELERVCAGFRRLTPGPLEEDRRHVRRRTLSDGTVQIEMRLLPDEAERVWQALCETRRAMQPATNDSAEASAGPATTSGPSLADAAVAIAEASLAAKAPVRGTPAAERRTLFIHLSERRIAASEDGSPPWKAELQDGTALSGATLLRLTCDSGVVGVRTGARGDVMDLGRRRRTVSPAMSRVLRLRDRGCRFPGCQHTAFVDAHHIEHWAEGGATSLANLALVCHTHHVALHEGGFRLERGVSGELRFLDPDGRIVEPAPRPPTVGADVETWLECEQLARGIRIDRRTSLPSRSFIRPDFDGCVRALAWRQARAEGAPQ